MSGGLFCCSSVTPYRPTRTDHEAKFSAFLNAMSSNSIENSQSSSDPSGPTLVDKPFAVQIVRQINFGPLEWKKYFIPNQGQGEAGGFAEVTERELIDANFKKLNSFKNFKCGAHNKFFELNLYKIDPVNKHHWRADLARPASDIDI